MKVLLANKFFFNNGGSERVMFQERAFLISTGQQVVDFSMRDDRNVESPQAGYFVAPQNYRNGGHLARIAAALSLVHSREAVRKFGQLIDDTRPDLVHCHNVYHQLTPSIIGVAKARKIPVVLTLHDAKPVCPVYTRLSGGQPCSACLDGDFSQILRRRCADNSLAKSALLYTEAVVQRHLGSYEKVDSFIAPSLFMSQAVAHRFPESRIALLHNGVDVKAIRPLGSDEGYVLYLGRLSAEKGTETLLRAHASAAGDWALCVAGSGPLADDCQRRYANVRFVGHLTGDRLEQTIAGSSLVVVPSECHENCPMTVLEAMAHGKPVVGTRIGGIPELIVDGETGLLVEAGDSEALGAAISLLINEPRLRAAMGARARARAEKEFSIDRHNEGLMRIYTSLLDSCKVRQD